MAEELTEDEQRNCFDSFVTWFKISGGLLSDYVEFQYSAERGVHLCIKPSLQDVQIPYQTTILSCPHSMSLSALNAWDVMPHFSNHNPTDYEHNQLDLPEQLLAEARPQAIAALWLVAQRKIGKLSWWQDYINVLPGVKIGTSRYADIGILGMGQVNTPMWWEDDERRWVGGTNLEKGIENLEEVWTTDWQTWESEIKSWSTKNGWNVTKADFFWALTILGSRAFPSWLVANSCTGKTGLALLDEHDPDMILYPGMDMLNHNPQTRNRWRFDDNRFELIYNDEGRPGDEIFNPYGAKSNAQFLLSYGFAIDNNPHDTVALKLLRASKKFPAPRRRSHLQPDELVDIPSMVPAGVDLPRGLFFVRPISRHNIRDPDYPSSTCLNNHLLGFPYTLLDILAGDLEVPRERRARAERIAEDSALMGRCSPDRASHIDVYAELGQRNILAVTNLLLQMLRMQLNRLYAAETSKDLLFLPPVDSPLKRSRWSLSRTYRNGQKIILEENILLLSARLRGALTEQQELLPIGTALAYMRRVMLDAEWDAFAAGICAGLGLANASADAIWAAGADEPAWALLVGVAMQLSPDQRYNLHRFLRPADSGGYWLDVLAVRYPEDGSDESQATDEENAEALRGVIDSVQESLGLDGYWAKSQWDEAKVLKLARIVNRETLRVTLIDQDIDIASGLEQGAERGQVDITAMFVQ